VSHAHDEPPEAIAATSEPRDAFTARPSWSTVPAPVRARLTELIGSPTVSWLDLHGGISPGPAARLTLADGRCVFVKGGSAPVGPRSHQLHVMEADVLAGLPPTVPAARLLAVARTSDWIVLATTWIDGPTAGEPWTESAVRAVAEACELVAAHPAAASTPGFDRYDGHVGGPGHATEAAMRLLATEPSEASRFVVAVAGMWRFNATLPAHPGMPTRRRWQRDRAHALRPVLDAIRTRTNALRLR
jgi:hypothetical protein